MKITVLGSGAAGGVPMISVGWGRCDPENPKNRRRRPSILVEEGGQTILIDTSPDLREQLLDAKIRHLDAVLFTHDHADHTHGIDDLREVNRAMGGPIPAYGSKDSLERIQSRFSYVFSDIDLKTQPIFKPWLTKTEVVAGFDINGIAVSAIDQDHGYGRTTGFRFGRMAYCTDVHSFPDESLAQLHGLDLWIVGCLTEYPHPTHAHLGKVLDWVTEIKPKQTIITHMSPNLDYQTLCDQLPPHIRPAYDGLIIEI